MLREAIKQTDDEAIVYVHDSIESYQPTPRHFHLVVSSMALHYVRDYAAAVARVFDALRPGGRFVFSVEHPVCTANPAGWIRNVDGTPSHWPLDRYREEGERRTSWFVDGVVKFHRTVETYVTTLLSRGFRLDHLGEPGPTGDALAARPGLATEARRPPVLLLAATRPQSEHP